MYTVFFMTFGCKVNQYETECLKTLFRNSGFQITKELNSADAVIINSCTVTASGDSRVLSAMKKIRRNNPDTVIVLTGCYPQAFHEEAAALSEADIITGTKNRLQLPGLVSNYLSAHERIVDIPCYSADDEFECITCSDFENNTRAFLKIQDGCNQFCTYCIIPYARGRCRSKPIDVLRAEVEALASKGMKEIVLSGINLAFYGKEYGLNLADAAEACASVQGIERIRLGSLEPEKMSDELLQRLSALPQFCPQFHLSLQSGCSETLKAMNRKYTAEEYSGLVRKIRRIFPSCSVTTDVMVGFPGESDADFESSLNFVRNTGFSRVHVFRYSRRKGTPADRMTNQIPERIKTERWQKMTAAAALSQAEYLKNMIGKTVPVLFERENCTDFHHGYAPDYTLIKIPRENSKKSLRNMIFCVKIEESGSDYCIGRISDQLEK